MATTSLARSSLKTLTKYDSFLVGNAAYDPGATFFISRFTATGGETTITLSSIPQTYSHLQLRCITKDTYTGSNGAQELGIRFNGDSGNNYAAHRLQGNGSAVSASGGASQGIIDRSPIMDVYGNLANYYGAAIIDIHNYASTTQYKTVRAFTGADMNGDGKIALASGLWMSTAGITSIAITGFISGAGAGSTFALYGMVG